MDSPIEHSDSDTAGNNTALLYELSTMTEETLIKLSIASNLYPLESSQIVQLEAELNLLKGRLQLLEDEVIDIKRKRWCCWCLQEAVFASRNNQFYCCTQCEQLDYLLSSDKL